MIEQTLNIEPAQRQDPAEADARPDITLALTRGAGRLLRDLGFQVIMEFTLPNGRRADIAGLDRKGRLVIAEVKSCREDFCVDQKWQDYLDFCDYFYFVTRPDFPHGLLPAEEGLMVADAYGAAIRRAAPQRPLMAARRKALMIKFARNAAKRLHHTLEDR